MANRVTKPISLKQILTHAPTKQTTNHGLVRAESFKSYSDVGEYQLLPKRKISPKVKPARSDLEERKDAHNTSQNQNANIYDYMRDTFFNISYKYKGGLDRKSLAKSLNSINETSYFFSSEKQQKPVAYILNEKFNPNNVRASRHRDAKDDHMQYINKIVNQIQESFEAITWFTYRANIVRPLYGSNKTSDAGWGCMLRTGQMMLC